LEGDRTEVKLSLEICSLSGEGFHGKPMLECLLLHLRSHFLIGASAGRSNGADIMVTNSPPTPTNASLIRDTSYTCQSYKTLLLCCIEVGKCYVRKLSKTSLEGDRMK
jgi:hypothetical protein